ncbi:DUF930 domain-containing protein [Pannonibacter tanglangensis]|uniref:DUF930 domain-containing protein n=1 Tax=Pannonibacter tanglangensis TaxID=2750084 RepID=A0ABW9ZI62_9HYPH|nr:DUF930 domain-containing protein [Pannonibacter sp. XCT-34]NBN63306.1 DUF930 domain-containing protein [Pannonibacter sp. XCT-34]
MDEQTVSSGIRFGGAVVASLVLHIVLAGLILAGAPSFLPSPPQTVVDVTLVAPPELPQPEPSQPEQPQPEPQQPEQLQPEQPAPPPAPAPEAAPEAAPETAAPPAPPVPDPAPVDPAPAPGEQPQAEPQPQAATAPLPVLVPVVEFGEEDSGPEAQADGSAAAAPQAEASEDAGLSAPETVTADAAAAEEGGASGGAAGDGTARDGEAGDGEAGPDGPEAVADPVAEAGAEAADEGASDASPGAGAEVSEASPEARVEDPAVAEAAADPEAPAAPAAGAIGAVAARPGDRPELQESPADGPGLLPDPEAASTLVGPLMAAAPPKPKPPVSGRQTASAEATPPPGAIRPGRAGSGEGTGSGSGSGSGVLAELSPSRRLFSNTLSGDSRARTAMRGMPREQRADLLCMTELRAQLRAASRTYDPEILPTFRLRVGTILATERAGFRAGGYWYDVAFRCEMDEGITRVVAFAFKVRGAVPRGEWAARGFPAD